ncbi:MAG: AMP-dependent synthetase/ligase [Candidatus Marinimicrobia bacterium]|nr:AMP-dependent synthetase/ligase [Candidatus Neomarinimicrobiota bacterium]
METIRDMLEQAAQRKGTGVALRHKVRGKWHAVTYAELRRRSGAVSRLLTDFGVQAGQRVGLFMENSPEWIESYFGIVACGVVAVPIDAKLLEQEVAHILRDSGAVALLAGARAYPLLRDIEALLPDLRQVWLVGGAELLPAEQSRCAYGDYQAAVTERLAPAANDPPPGAPAPDDLASLIYTSGTTGRQKGIMLTHANFMANVQSCRQVVAVRTDDNFLVVLPLHHAFAFIACLLLPVASGAEMSLVESLKTVGENMSEVQPTVLVGVPLLLEKMYGKIRAGINQKTSARWLCRLGLGRVVGRKILAKLGGRLRLVVTGGAPCDPAVLQGWERLGIPVREGYGLTETAPVLTLNPIECNRLGSVGRALPGVELRIDEPNAEGIGEICARGANVMRGYYNNPEATAAVLRDGWLYTGDLGRLDRDGFLTISGRKKSLIVNREGKNIYPEEVEHQILQSPYVLETLVLGYHEHGETTGERVGAILVPNQDAVDRVAAARGQPLSDAEVEALLQEDVRRVCRALAEYKRPRRLQIRYEELEKTSTTKVKRYLYALNTPAA